MKRPKRSVFLNESAAPKAVGPRGRLVPVDKLLDGQSSQLVVAEGHRAAPQNHPVSSLTQLPVESSKLSMWPSRGAVALHKTQKSAKAPLVLQLEAFVRKEHRQYLLEHPDCSRTDTLHIFREAFGVLVNHFTEYKSLLDLIRDEYDAALMEMAEQVKTMTVVDLENKSDRSLHAMELMHLKESLQATISNQQAQLRATQGLLHALREQLAAAEHANSVLKFEMERKLKEHDDAQDHVKLLSQALVEESARTALVMDSSKKKDREMELLNARIKVLKENLEELETCLRDRMRGRPTDVPKQKASGAAVGNAEDGACTYTDEYVHQLLTKVDKLEFELTKVKDPSGASVMKTPATEVLPKPSDAVTTTHSVQLAGTPFPHVREWMRLEGINEAEIEAANYLIPSGLWAGDDMTILKACAPVRNRYLGRKEILLLLEDMWETREKQTTYTRLPVFFTDWLTSKTGGGAAMKELGVNLLHGCHQNLDHPECRTLLLLLRGYLPEELVVSWRRMLRHLLRLCESSIKLENDAILIDELFEHIRSLWPEKHKAHMLQLRFFLFRQDSAMQRVDFKSLLSNSSYFVTLLKQQYLREVESFTLQVVEGIRQLAAGRSFVLVSKVLQFMEGLDKGMGQETLCAFIAGASQRTVMEVATKDLATTVKLDTMLFRFRTQVLLRRATPPDGE